MPKSSLAPLQQSWNSAQTDNEIDLRELILELWHNKLLIFSVVTLFAMGGWGYSLSIPSVWSTKATIDNPLKVDILPLLKKTDQINQLGLGGVPSGNELFSEFIREFNKRDNQRDFLRKSSFFKHEVIDKNLDAQAQHRWLQDWSMLIRAEVLAKPKEPQTKTGYELIVAADSPETSTKLHEAYTKYISALQKKRLTENLIAELDIKLKALSLQQNIMAEDAKIRIERDRKSATYSMNVAKAANIEKPIENYNGSDRFSASLGVGALTEQAKILDSMTLDEYQPKLVDLKVAIKRLKEIDLTGIDFKSFTYLDSPNEPLARDKPKRSLIVVLAALLGGMFGVGIVLVRFSFRDK